MRPNNSNSNNNDNNSNNNNNNKVTCKLTLRVSKNVYITNQPLAVSCQRVSWSPAATMAPLAARCCPAPSASNCLASTRHSSALRGTACSEVPHDQPRIVRVSRHLRREREA